jgi:hypothetical protein
VSTLSKVSKTRASFAPYEENKMAHVQENQMSENNSQPEPGPIKGQISARLSDEETMTRSTEPSLTKGDVNFEDTEKGEKGEPSDVSAEPEDPNVVNWDGPDDPQNPMNFPESVKWGNIGALSVLSTLTPLASSMFAPAVPQLMEHFNSNRYGSQLV